MKVIDDDDEFIFLHASLLPKIVAMDIRYRAPSLGLATIGVRACSAQGMGLWTIMVPRGILYFGCNIFSVYWTNNG